MERQAIETNERTGMKGKTDESQQTKRWADYNVYLCTREAS